MENLPERQHPHAHLRASDTDRDQVVDVLRDALMSGRLSQDEHAERLEQTLQAKTLGELEPITRDLVVPGQGPAPVPAAAVSNSPVPIEEPANPADSFDTMVAIFGGGERKGRWRVKRRTNAVAVFGGHDLDMTDAVFEGREVTIWAFAVFGGIDITVPDAVGVRNEGVGIFGGFAARGGDNPDPNAPVVVVKGLALFGGVGGQVSSKRHKKRFKNPGGHGHSHGHGQLGH
ncbi:cell wall-active antibiotic response 4TMS protein YvqF [Kribbella antiqua]|uniref:Cell wall-active antibiotic response 4TMS protein YvqF n=1 Tax=Kribbella antiqua TaxID=2512217 RepID=A0A4V2S4J2_9ACTN|nr:DUF1707 domain-containing protein [Kribbella antiqua]TCO48440.1 cell wall-active antibiotic response 4TMS protein YvqF [Kribbella antiqua]